MCITLLDVFLKTTDADGMIKPNITVICVVSLYEKSMYIYVANLYENTHCKNGSSLRRMNHTSFFPYECQYSLIKSSSCAWMIHFFNDKSSGSYYMKISENR